MLITAHIADNETQSQVVSLVSKQHVSLAFALLRHLLDIFVGNRVTGVLLD